MSDYKMQKTTYDVWRSILLAHSDLVVFGSFSAPEGDYFGNADKGLMFTSYGFKNGEYPIMQAETTWDILEDHPNVRANEEHNYWLCYKGE